MDTIKIGNYTIVNNHKPFVIAEMSGNHNQSLQRALDLVDAAAAAGAAAETAEAAVEVLSPRLPR